MVHLRRHKGKSDLLLFTKWDRFSRNTSDAYQMISMLKKLGVEPQAVAQPLNMDVPENKMSSVLTRIQIPTFFVCAI